MGAASDMGETILQLKISLVGASSPPVWRRVLVPAEIRLDRFHEVIQAAMGWEGYHMHVFTNGSAEYGLADPELGHQDERRTMLTELLTQPGDRIRYAYDFGDGWEHDILVEEVLAAEPDAPYPICLTGKGACPPEDCGGVWGYERLREVLADTAHEEHEDMLDWLGLDSASEFDPSRFDVDEVNGAVGLMGAARR